MATEASPRELIEAELARLCEGERMRRSPSHVRLLRYLVNHAVERDHAALTETAIGIAVFRREPGVFDPQVDPIVRVSVGRLRARLAACYADSGSPPLRIDLPGGHYAPQFVFAGDPAGLRVRLLVRRMRNACGLPGQDAFCRTFTGMLRDALSMEGEQVALAGGTAAGAGEPPPVPRGRRSRAPWTLLDPVLSSDANGYLRVTVRLLDGLDAQVRWIETAAGEPERRGSLGELIIARVVARLATAGNAASGG